MIFKYNADYKTNTDFLSIYLSAEIKRKKREKKIILQDRSIQYGNYNKNDMCTIKQVFIQDKRTTPFDEK